MKYDDAGWHYNDKFPKESPREYSGTHIALLLKWCFLQGWAGALHLDENPDDVENVRVGKKPATEFLFQWCDGKFTNEDLNEGGNTFVEVYYGKSGAYLNDYGSNFGELLFVAPEVAHDFARYSAMVEERYREFRKKSTP